MTKRIYISGPITSSIAGQELSIEQNLQAFSEAEKALAAFGYVPVSPDIGQYRPNWQWTDYMRAALALLITCDGVALLTGWSYSNGAKLERQVGLAIGIPVKNIGHWVKEVKKK